MDVWISSGTHVDDIAEREDRIEEQFGKPDVVFAEGAEKSTDREQLISILRIIPYAPVLAAAVIVHIYVTIELHGKIKSIVTDGENGRDVDIVRNLTSRHGIDRREIDNEPLGQYIHNHPLIWGIANWGALLGVTYSRWPSPLTVWNVIQYGTGLLLVGYILLFVLLAVANYAREETMTEVISNDSGKHDRAVVILGEAHHPGVGERLADESGLNVINPEPEDLRWQTRVILPVFRKYDQLKGR